MNLLERKKQLVRDVRNGAHVLIAAHRGAFTGNIIQNTINAYHAAVRMGADIIECDVARTVDGHLLAFHDGGEPRAFGRTQNIKTLPFREARNLCYFNSIGAATDQRVQTFEEVLAALKGDVLINVDRGWEYWADIVETVERYGMAEQIILKSPVADEILRSLQEVGRNYMYIPIVDSTDDIDRALSYDLNVLGVEIKFRSADQDIVAPEYLKRLKELGLLLWSNAIKLNHIEVLAATFDDDVSVLSDPDKGWGRLLDMGFDIIQTDWPNLLKEYLDSRGVSCAPSTARAEARAE